MRYSKQQVIWILLRLGMGLIFLWAFLDKVFGLGFSTLPGKAWLDGVSPTQGFLQFGAAGPFASIFQSMAGSAIVDWLFMLGLLFVGACLLLGVGMRITGYSGSLMLLLMWLAVLPPEHHPFLDEHIIYIFVLLGLTYGRAGQWLGLGKWWREIELVKKYPILE